jgi:hypothetical protein
MRQYGLLLKQYELLRREIVQCIYLRQLAIIAVCTAILTGTGVAFVHSNAIGPASESGMLPFVALGLAFAVNCFGSLYLHEQHRNRRACVFNRVIERLVTSAASKDCQKDEEGGEQTGQVGENSGNNGKKNAEDVTCDFLGWENFLVSDECKEMARPFYTARYLGVGLPLLLFAVPLFAATVVVFGPYTEFIRGFARATVAALSMAGLLGCVATACWAAWRETRPKSGTGARPGDQDDSPDEKEQKQNRKKRGKSSHVIHGLVAALYISPLVAIAKLLLPYDKTIPHPDLNLLGLESAAEVRALLLSAVVLACFLGLWTLYIFFHVTKSLGQETPQEAEERVGKWILNYCDKYGCTQDS